MIELIQGDYSAYELTSHKAYSYEPLSKLLASPLITPIVPPYIITHNTPFKEFRLKLI